MNDKEEKELIKDTKKAIIGSLVTFLFLGGGGLTVFYFNTSNVQAQNTEQIKENTIELKKITTIPKLNEKQIKNLEAQVTEIKENQKEFQKETKQSIEDIRKTNLKMLELLYQIKQQNNN